MAGKAPANMAEAVRRALGRTISATLAGALALAVLPFLVTATSASEAEANVMDIRPDAPHSPVAVLAEAEAAGVECWQGKAPDDVDGLPGSVIWQRPSGRTVRQARLVGPALDAIFADGTLPGRPVAFCR